MNSWRDKRAGSHSPGELPCLGKQAPALARRETCQGLICVFVHKSVRANTPGQRHMNIRKGLSRNDSTFSELQLVNALYMHYYVFIRVNTRGHGLL